MAIRERNQYPAPIKKHDDSPYKDEAYKTPAEVERSGIDNILFYIGILLRYKWIIVGFTFLAGVAVVVYAYISLTLPPEESPMPNYYEASAHLIMNAEGGNASEMILSSLGVDPRDATSSTLGETAQMVLQSRSTVDRLADKLDIYNTYGVEPWDKKTARKIVQNSAGISLDYRTGSLWITYQHIDPIYARDAVQAMIDVLDEWFSERGGSAQAQQLRLLEDKLDEVSANIESLESQIREMQSEYRVLSIDELAEAQSTLLNDLRSQRAQKELEIRNYSQISRINDPKRVLLQVELQNLTELINQIERGDYSSLPAQDQLPDLASRFSRLSGELALQQRIYQTLSEQYEIARLADVDEPAYEILEAPEVPVEKAGPSRSEMVLKVVAGAFFGSIALALGVHFLQQLRLDPNKMKLLNQ